MINIITIHGGVNYGAVFQAYALNKFLLNTGFSSQIIDYNRQLHQNSYCKMHFCKNPKQLIKNFKTYKNNKKRTKLFNQFIISKNTLTKKAYNGFNAIREEDFDVNDVFVAGSDQIWNLDMTLKNTHYLLDFTQSKNKFSYASSIGQSELSKENEDILKEYLSKFKKVTVREQTAKNLLLGLGIDSTVVVDPTFLLGKNDWLSLASKRDIGKEYLLIFVFNKDEKFINLARKKALEEDLKIISIDYLSGKISGAKNLSVVSPEDWLSLINGAKYVFTNSFHGLALSINLEKQVYAYNNGNSRISRITDFAKVCGIEHMVLTKDSDSANGEIKYPIENLEKFREESKKILIEMVENK